ncbi:hypothetical protein [Pseudofrankia sp. EUN1h]|uniref:hypothetical protein n=2 Tax=Pseudofrankia TaxID=2994363 RepID=UPI0010421B13|nr:hypothetical protein [Pseudofrankia sp. EUN1h]
MTTYTQPRPSGGRHTARGGETGGGPRRGARLVPGGARSVAMTGALALCPAFLTWWLVFGLGYHRADLTANLPPTPLVVLLVGVAAWATMLAVTALAESWRTASDRRRDRGDLARFGVPLVAAAYLLVAFGVLARLRLAGLTSASPGFSLTGLMLSLGVGAVGLVLLADLVRSGGSDSLVRLPAEDAERAQSTTGLAGRAVLGVALAVVVFAAVDRFDDALLAPGGLAVRPVALVPFLLVAAFAVFAMWYGLWGEDDDPDAGPAPRLGPAVAAIALVLAAVLGPAHPTGVVASVVGVAVAAAVLTRDRLLAAVGTAVAVGGYLGVAALFDVTHTQDVFQNGYAAGPARHAASALARGGWGGSGPGLGLVEGYTLSKGSGSNGYQLDGVVPDTDALRVVGEELGLAGLLVLLVAAVAVGLLAVLLARRCGRGVVGAWARGLAAVTVVTLAVPVLPLLWPGFHVDVAMPGVSADGVSLVVLLWTVGALLGAAGRTARQGAPVAAAARQPPAAVAGRARRDDRDDGVPRLVAVGCVLAMVIALPVAAANENRHSSAADDTAAVSEADRYRPKATIDVGWAGLDEVTRKALSGRVGAGAWCPAKPPAQAPGGGFGARCPQAAEATLDGSAQQAAVDAMTKELQPGAVGSVVALEVSDGKLLTLATGTGTGTGGSGGTAPPATATPSATPTPSVTPTPSTAATPSGPPSPSTPSPTGGAKRQESPKPSSGASTSGGGAGASPSTAGPKTPPPADANPLSAAAGPGRPMVTPAGVSPVTADPSGGARTGSGRVDREGWWAAAPTGDIGSLLILSALSSDSGYDAAAKTARDQLRREALQVLVDQKQTVAGKPIDQRQVDDAFAPAPPDRNAADRILASADEAIRKDPRYQACVELPKDPHSTPRFLAGERCGKVLALVAGALPAPTPAPTPGKDLSPVLGPLLTAVALDGKAGEQLGKEGLDSGDHSGVDGITVGSAQDCGPDLSTCLWASPLQVATALAGLATLNEKSPGKLPAPYLLTGGGAADQDRQAGDDLTALKDLGDLGTRATFSVLAGDAGAWSVQFVKDGAKITRVVVAYVAASDGNPDLAAAAARALTAPVADVLDG